MADLKIGEPFGLDPLIVKSIDWELAIKRIIHDLRSDFIYAPHLAFIYRRAASALIAEVKSDLSSGKFSPSLPITIEVPKSFRIQVATNPKRLGPSYSRPGSILLPRDRLLYQALADQAAPVVQAKTDHTRSFSHQLAAADSAIMFLPTRVCWNTLQKKLAEHAETDIHKYILKMDVAHYFGSLNQHTLINTLKDAKYNSGLASRLEALLINFTGGERSSRGIVQGIFPSDLFGNFYMEPVDRFLADLGLASARYVDDLYVFVESVDAADQLMRQLIPFLRTYDLVLNEVKSVIIPKSALTVEEPDLDALFSEAIAEISAQVEDEDFDTDYGFQSEWDDDEEEEDDIDGDDDDGSELELKATCILFDSIPTYQGHEEKIERFCLPLFTKAQSDYAIHNVIDAFPKRPSMSQIYCAYLSLFMEQTAVLEFLFKQLKDTTITDWQKMWVVAALSQLKEADDAAVKAALDILKDANRHDALRAVAAIFVARFGDLPRRKSLVAIYGSVPPYIQSAIYFASQFWPSAEKTNAKGWASMTPLNSLITAAISAKGQKS